ncbi:hypothetical protein A2765_02275 [Candidatus Kaiserbacteria bacterium RIFCSPHIGHO2_01_FULL_56_24]|uniref:Uncharacterized protein n=1 Tax=Candidatus Kaiserbacteria bacterium RIFCSPHIGHO2_01_FULL_56_24 TaxID=1798487 RepID=A0A1F6DAZ7_9BACT|nr:MAG: hypothetical protein A2765_02275 [Candidatus Kaiserbacteria bacterium RIFCSPHIGHO2_01_FULL_56_24]
MVLHEGGDYREMISGPEDSVAAPAPASKPGWVHSHPYIASSIAVGTFVVFGSILVLQRVDVSPSNASGAWGGAGGLFFGAIRNAAPTGPSPDDIVRIQSSTQANYGVIPIFTPPTENADGSSSADNDIAALLAQLTQNTPVASTSFEASAPDSYSFIPQGLISTEVPVKKRSALQQSLFSYGNQMGTYIKGFEAMHYGSAQILKDHVEDRANPDKIRAVKLLAADMRQLGTDFLYMSGVPAAMAEAHKAYGNAYRAAGAALLKVAATESDSDFVNAITAYNASVEEMSKRFQLLVALFGANDVAFSASDEGNVFMFTPNLTLVQ